MDKKDVIKKLLIGLGVIAGTGLIIYGSTQIGGDRGGLQGVSAAELKKCKATEIVLDVTNDESVARTCLAENQYKQLKDGLKADLQANKSKGYDFDINNREILFAVFNKEIQDKGISIKGANKEKIKEELLKLLD